MKDQGRTRCIAIIITEEVILEPVRRSGEDHVHMTGLGVDQAVERTELGISQYTTIEVRLEEDQEAHRESTDDQLGVAAHL